ncbi:MAG: carboxypeptidase-like regulatory domain-containing protein [Acidobacteriaceae bacterium]
MNTLSIFRILRSRVLPFVVAAVLAVVALPSYAQFGGSLTGSVQDTSGAAIPGATVTLTNLATKQVKSITTDGSGVYTFTELGFGSYTLSATASSFSAATVNNVSIAAESPRNVDVTLKTGKTSETVTVNADTLPLLQTGDASIGSTLDNEQIERLPVVGGNVYELLRTAPGIIGDGARSGNGNAIFLPNGAGPGGSSRGIFQTENQTQISANGQRVADNTYQIDGVTVDSLTHGGSAVVTANQEAVGQITALTSTYDAADGRNTGAQIKVVTKNGTNQIHGSLFFRYDEPGLNAFARYGGPNGQKPVRASAKQRTYDASVGFPIFKDKLFFFASFEGFGLAGNSFGTQFIETPQFDAAVIAQRPGGVAARIIAAPGNAPRVLNVLPVDCTQFNGGNGPCAAVGGGLDVGSLTPGGASQLGTFTGTAGAGLDGIPDLELAQLSFPNHSRGRQFNGRVDYYLTQKDQLAASFYSTKLDNYGQSGSNGARPNEDVPFKPLNTAGTIIYIHTFSPTWLNEFRANGTRFADNAIADGGGIINFGIPFINIQGVGVSNNVQYGINGGSVTTPGIFAQNTFEIRDQVTHIFGAHAIHFGGEIRFEQNNDNLPGLTRPLYAVQGLFNFANDAPIFELVNANTATGGPANTQLYLRDKNIAVYVQHDWKVTPTFTLNTGFRYEIYTPITNKNKNIGHPVLGPTGSELAGLKLVPQNQFYNTDYGHYGPKIGFAWVPTYYGGKVVFRGGAGISYNHLDAALFENQSFDNAQGAATFGLCCATDPASLKSTGITFVLGSSNNVNSFPANPALAVGTNANGFPANGAGIELYGTGGTIRNPVSYLYSLENQVELPARVVMTVGYSGSIGRHYARLVNQNFLYNNANSPVFQSFFAQTDGVQSYNSLNVRVVRPISHGLLIEGNYTFSKSLDQVSNGDSPNANANQTNPANNHTEYGPSDYDSRNRFTITALYTSPRVHTGNAILNAAANGWQANTIITGHSGFPFTPVTFNLQANVITNAAVVGPTRPLGILGTGGPIGSSCSNEAFKSGSNFPNRGAGGTNGGVAYFNITPPVLPPGQPYIYTPGIGRNSFNGPCYRDVDLTLAKQVDFSAFGDQHAFLRFQATMFNAFNLLQLSPITNGNAGGGANINDGNFGKATNVDAGRVIELSMRLNF